MKKPSWETQNTNSSLKRPSWETTEASTLKKPSWEAQPVSTTTKTPEIKTPIDQRLHFGGDALKDDSRSYIGMNIIPAYKEDTGLAKVGKGIVNYGIGGAVSLAGNIFGAPQQAMMQTTRAGANALTGKKQDFSEMSFGRDILGAKEDNLLTTAIATGLDPTTYIGGGILDDLSRAGQFGKGATLGTIENLEANAALGLKASTKKVKGKRVPILSEQTASREYLNAERNALKKDSIKTPEVIYATDSGIAVDKLVPENMRLPAGKTIKNIIPYTDNEVKNLSSHKGVVNGKNATWEGFIAAEKKGNDTKRFYFGKVSSELGEKIKTATGFNVEGYNVAMRSDDVRHTFAKHGNPSVEIPRGQIPITDEILVKLPYVIENPDEIVKLGTRDYAGREAFEFKKRINGYAISIAGKSDGRHSIEIDSFWVVNNKKPLTTSDALRPQTSTSMTSSKPASNNSIPQDMSNINPPAEVAIPPELKNDEIYNNIMKELEGTGLESDDIIKTVAPGIKDKSGLSYNMTDIYRNLRDSFGNSFDYVKGKILDPLDASKKAYVDTIKKYSDDIYNRVVRGLGINRRSKESKAVMWYGEKQRIVGYENMIDPQTGKKISVPKMESYTLEDLQREFPQSWQRIVEADGIFRQHYDELIDSINESRKSIYPYVETEIESLKKRGLDIDNEIANKKQNLEMYNKQQKLIEDAIASKKSMMAGKKKTDTKAYLELERQVINLEKRKNDLASSTIEFAKRRIDDLAKQRNEITDKLKSDDLLHNKRLQKRSDYYRHFKDMSDSFAGLKNMFETPSQIDPRLAGISDTTAPKSRWASFFQRRGMGAYDEDAVGGFINYIQPASYAIHIDPHISKVRGLAKDIAESTVKSKNANNLIKYLSDYANNLAGKTSKYDRLIQEDIPGGRTAMRVLTWLNNRVKGNQVLLNARSAISQLANVPVGVARVKDPVSLGKGISNTLAGIIGKGEGAKLYGKSQFISERYSQDLISRFDTRLRDQPKKFAAWLLGAFDEVGTKFVWNSSYSKAVSEGVKDPIKYADDLTRSVVAGRGIGEVPLMQQSKTFQLIAPFQLEVANLWHVMGDMVKEKDFGGLVTLFVGNYLFNNLAEELTGNRVTFDPIDAIVDALTEEDMNAWKMAGRLGGEVLSNVPLGQTIASLFPDYNTTVNTPVGEYTIPSKQELFGRNDPTRFGSGLLIAKGFQDPLTKLAPPFGGAQIKKTVEAVDALNKGGVFNDEKLKYIVENSPENAIKGALFGKGAFNESKDYYDNNRRELSEKQTAQVMNSSDKEEMYDVIMHKRVIEALKNKIKAIKNSKLSGEQKVRQIEELRKQLEKAVN